MKTIAAILLLCLLLTSCATTSVKDDKPIVCYQQGTQDPPPWYNHPAFVASMSLLSGVTIVGGAWILKTNVE